MKEKENNPENPQETPDNTENPQKAPDKAPAKEDETVSLEEVKALRKAVEDFKNDMFKYKGRNKELEEQLGQVAADKEAQKMEALKEQNKWEEIAQIKDKKAKELAAKLEEKDSAIEAIKKQTVNFQKESAVIQALGGLKKTKYREWLELDNVLVDSDGNIVPESLQNEVDRFKQEHPEALVASAAADLPSSEAPDNSISEKNYADMSEAEKESAYKKMVKDRIEKEGIKPSGSKY